MLKYQIMWQCTENAPGEDWGTRRVENWNLEAKELKQMFNSKQNSIEGYHDSNLHWNFGDNTDPT